MNALKFKKAVEEGSQEMNKSEVKNLTEERRSIKMSLIGFPKIPKSHYFKNLSLNSTVCIFVLW